MLTVMLNGSSRYSLPKAVYFQCLWAVKDMDRLMRIRDHANLIENAERGEMVLVIDERESILTEDVVEESRRKLDCIRDALEEIPEEYRNGIIENIKDMKDPGDIAHSNTWKHWRQRFIYSLAKNLRLY